MNSDELTQMNSDKLTPEAFAGKYGAERIARLLPEIRSACRHDFVV